MECGADGNGKDVSRASYSPPIVDNKPPLPTLAPDASEPLMAACFEHLLDQADIGFWMLNSRLRQGRWNQGLRILHGLAPDAPTPSPSHWLRTFVHPDDRQHTQDFIRRWLTSGNHSVRHRLRILGADGVTRTLLSHSGVAPHDADLRFGLLQAEADESKLMQGRGTAGITADAMGLGTWVTDLQTGVMRWDNTMWLLCGRTPQAGAPDDDARMALTHPDDRQWVRAIYRSNQTLNYEFRVLWPDGQVRWLAARTTTLHDEQGRPMQRTGVHWDVTAQREAQAALHAREVALRESETRSRLLARISHELRTPLNAILGVTQLLQQDERPAQGHGARLADIEAAGQQLLTLVDRVLDLTGDAGTDAAPATPLIKTPPADTPSPAAPAGPRRTLLYIEDNTVNAMIVSELVARRGDIDVVIAATGFEGLDKAVQLQPALVLLDMQLPDIDGGEVFRRLRADPRTAALPCVALSANVLRSDIDAALAAGMTAYWTKPLDFRAFSKALDGLLGPAPR